MKHSPKIFSATCAIIALSSSLALAAEAPAPIAPAPGAGIHNGHGAHAMAGHSLMGPLAQLSPEKQEAAKRLMDANAADMFPLHQNLYAKHAELEALNANGEGESGKAKAVIRDIADLNAKMLQVNGSFRARLFKETGLRVPVMGHGGMGTMGARKGGMGCGLMGGQMGAMTAPAPAAPLAAPDHSGH